MRREGGEGGGGRGGEGGGGRGEIDGVHAHTGVDNNINYMFIIHCMPTLPRLLKHILLFNVPNACIPNNGILVVVCATVFFFAF